MREGRNAAGRLVTRALHAILFVGTMVVVGLGHRAVFRASGHGLVGFWRAAWREFRRDLAAMQPAPVRVRVVAPTSATPLGGHA